MTECLYQYTLPGASHWSIRLRRGLSVKLTDLEGDANVGALFYNPENLLERYNAPDTLKGQHTFKLTKGHCLFSDMGRIFCSIVEDDSGWHETVCGNSTASIVAERWGERDYQTQRNSWHQNGHDSFLVELAKYGMSVRDLAANVNFFSCVQTDEEGRMQRKAQASQAGSSLTLRFEMDTLLVLHTCPHPLDLSNAYPYKPVQVEIFASAPFNLADDPCANHCDENKRGFANNRLYYLGE